MFKLNMKTENRIQINGEWYVKESTITDKKLEIEDSDIARFEGAVYENKDYCWEATKDYRNDGTLYEGVNIKFTNKSTGKIEYWDNDDWMVRVHENEVAAMETARESMSEEGVAHFQAFIGKLVEMFWI
jgi:hypothetical protein